jgi:transposase
VLTKKVWRRLLAVEADTVIEGVDFDEDGDAVVVSVRSRRAGRLTCGRCGRPSARYDRGEGRRRWRTLDLGAMRWDVEADAPRVVWHIHGVVVATVPWARHGAGHTRAFDDMVAWLAVRSSKTAVGELTRIAWSTVGAVIARVVADARRAADPFDGLVKIGVDEISYK